MGQIGKKIIPKTYIALVICSLLLYAIKIRLPFDFSNYLSTINTKYLSVVESYTGVPTNKNLLKIPDLLCAYLLCRKIETCTKRTKSVYMFLFLAEELLLTFKTTAISIVTSLLFLVFELPSWTITPLMPTMRISTLLHYTNTLQRIALVLFYSFLLVEKQKGGKAAHKELLFPVTYGTRVMLQFPETGYLFSTNVNYPHLNNTKKKPKYTSKGQIVSSSPTQSKDTLWVIHTENENSLFITDGDVVHLRHERTRMLLSTHDVASWNTMTNTEITCFEDATSDTRWIIHVEKGTLYDGQRFVLQHNTTRVYLNFTNHALPDWGMGTSEVNGIKNFIAESCKIRALTPHSKDWKLI